MISRNQKHPTHSSHSPAHLPVEIPHFGNDEIRIAVNRFLQAARQKQQVVAAIAVEVFQVFLAKVIHAISRLGEMLQGRFPNPFHARFLRILMVHERACYRASQFTEMEALFLTPALIRVDDATSLPAHKNRQGNRFCSY